MFEEKFKKIYLIGIGGIGMSGIAEILNNMSFDVEGSDLNENANTKRLRSLGIRINISHCAKNINKSEVDLIVYSSAIKDNNIELREGKKLQIPIISRAMMLGQILRFKSSITIAGSHGKTTTTSLIASLLEEAGMDPTVINGGIINNYKTNAKLGKGNWIIAEADESDGSFDCLPSTICLINNIDPEHLDYHKSFENLKNAFISYASKIPFFGFIAACIDDSNVELILKKLRNKKILTYGLKKKANVSCNNIKIKKVKDNFFSNFDVTVNLNDQYSIKNVLFPMIGNHNILNALGAISIAIGIGIKKKHILSGLKKFNGVKRRFSILYKDKNCLVLDDYAHHPKEIYETLIALRLITKGRIIAIHEPHRFSRLKSLFEEFSKCFTKADLLFLLPVYPAGEKKIKGINSEALKKKIKNCKVLSLQNSKELFFSLKNFMKINDSIIFLGAGPITKIAHNFVKFLKENGKEYN